MKRVIIVSISMLLVLGLVTGCGCNKKVNEKKKSKTNIKINNLIEEEVIKMNDEIMNSLLSLDENLLLTQFGLKTEEVEYYVAKIPEYNDIKPRFYIAIKPTNNSKNKVKKALDMYVENLKIKTDEDSQKNYENVLKQEYNGYYIYILSSNNEKVYEIIKNNLK